jgi:hypothetical protein
MFGLILYIQKAYSDPEGTKSHMAKFQTAWKSERIDRRIWDHYVQPKRRDLITQWRSVVYQKTGIVSYTAAIT